MRPSSINSSALTPVPGSYVRHPARPDWGVGQVQSAIGQRITVNFPHAGKVLIDATVISLEVTEPDDL